MEKLSNEEIIYTYDELLDLYKFFKNLEPLASFEEYLDSYNGIWFVVLPITHDSQICITGHDVAKLLYSFRVKLNTPIHLFTGSKKDRMLISLNIQKKVEPII